MCSKNKPITRLLVKSLYTLGAIIFVGVIWIISYKIIKNDYILPSLIECIKKTGKILVDKSFYVSFSNTLLRTLLAFLFSFFPAALLGIIAYMYSPIRHFIAPIMSFFRSMPIMAVLLIILVGTTPSIAPIVVAVLGIFPLIYNSILNSLSIVNPKLIVMSNVFEVPLYKKIFKLYIPTAIPFIIKECIAIISFSLKIVVSAEILAGTMNSIGGMLNLSSVYSQMPDLFALTIIVLLTGLMLECIGEFLFYMIEGRKNVSKSCYKKI